MEEGLGIDLGLRTRTAIEAVALELEVKRTTPSVVAFTKSGERLAGEPPNGRPSPTPEHRLLHQALHGPQVDEVEEERKRVPYKVVAGPTAMLPWKWKWTANPSYSARRKSRQ